MLYNAIPDLSKNSQSDTKNVILEKSTPAYEFIKRKLLLKELTERMQNLTVNIYVYYTVVQSNFINSYS